MRNPAQRSSQDRESGSGSVRRSRRLLRRPITVLAIAAGGFVLLSGVAAFIVWRASQVVPEFYAEALQADPAQLRQASDGMIQKSTLLANDVRKAGRWEALFREEEINGWLAVDLKENHGAALPAEITDPRIVVEPGRLQLACRARPGGIETVLSMELEVYLAQPGVVAIRIRSARAGALPLPLAGVLDQIGQLGDHAGLLVEWQQTHGDPVALVHIEPVVKGNRVALIDNLELAEHEIYVSGTTASPDAAAESPDAAAADSKAD